MEEFALTCLGGPLNSDISEPTQYLPRSYKAISRKLATIFFVIR
jgi:hypothetical protein